MDTSKPLPLSGRGQQALRTSREVTRQIIVGYPTLLNLSVEGNLQPKLDFFRDELQAAPEALRDTLVGTPTILGYSLTKRLVPRLKVMRSIGVQATFADHRWHVTSYTDMRFRKWLEARVIESLGAKGRGDARVKERMKAYSAVLRGDRGRR